MRDDLANPVFAVFREALQLRDQLQRGETLVFEVEQNRFRELLKAVARVAPADADITTPTEIGQFENATDPFQGGRYALVCWLDELFVLGSKWSRPWNERKLEVALYGSNDRAWAFWKQAQIAERRGDLDLLELFFLCVMLGFRGERIDEPDQLVAWVNSTRSKLPTSHVAEWQAPPERELPGEVPPRTAFERLSHMAFVGGIFALVAVPAAFVLIAIAMR